ncbi:cytochrome P450 [Mycolicibacterium palauense]|uniref:cytochrome P450 n=1 Tax=Mycolicibacterium palauense TaxID=2034511 RepID=UPI001FE387D3|nr:cytochrome P450 [Mycolicibacterium palauense]
MTARIRPPFADVRVGNLDFWLAPPRQREEEFFAPLRRTQPVSWQPPAEGTNPVINSDEDGFWAVTGHDEIVAISKDPATFCNGQGTNYDDFPPEAYEAAGSILVLDAPRHVKVRGLVSLAFTPRRLEKIRNQIAAQAASIVTDLSRLDSGECDFVEHVASRLPLWTISEMVGVPTHRRDDMIGAALKVNGLHDPDINQGREPAEVFAEGLTALHGLSQEIAEQRRSHPEDDLMTSLVNAEIDGEKLTQMEISSFFVLLCVAGNDTTRNSTSVAMHALSAHSRQWDLLVDDLDALLPTAIEEFLRWASPVITMRRTATRDTEFSGMKILEGDKVILFYPAANFDDRIFENPYTFDIRRKPNHHLAFGGGGPHYCMGAQLARMQLRSIFTELLTRVPDLQVGEPEFELNTIISSVKRMPCSFTPANVKEHA